MKYTVRRTRTERGGCIPPWTTAAREYKGENQEPELHKEPLKYEFIKVATRNYKD